MLRRKFARVSCQPGRSEEAILRSTLEVKVLRSSGDPGRNDLARAPSPSPWLLGAPGPPARWVLPGPSTRLSLPGAAAGRPAPSPEVVQARAPPAPEPGRRAPRGPRRPGRGRGGKTRRGPQAVPVRPRLPERAARPAAPSPTPAPPAFAPGPVGTPAYRRRGSTRQAPPLSNSRLQVEHPGAGRLRLEKLPDFPRPPRRPRRARRPGRMLSRRHAAGRRDLPAPRRARAAKPAPGRTQRVRELRRAS